MANTLWITEYPGYEFGSLPAAVEPCLANQTVTIGVSSTQSSAFSQNTHLVRVVADAACSIAFGPSPTAVAGSTFLPSGIPEYFVVQPAHKLACITNS